MSGSDHQTNPPKLGEIETAETNDAPLRQTATLGSVRLLDAHTGKRKLVPEPTDDPNDPLSW
jgi:hypothetical protein